MNALLQIPHVTADMLFADFWIQKINTPDRPLLEPGQIADFNTRIRETLGIADVFELPETLPRTEVEALINPNGMPSKPYYGGAGQRLDEAYHRRLVENATPENLPDLVPVRFGLITRRTSARVFPTNDVANDEPLELKTDIFQATALDIGWPVAEIATSRDGKWSFCLTPLYWGWVDRADFVLASRAIVLSYCQPEDWVVATASQGLVGLATDGGATPQMGTGLPLVEETDSSYRVQVPIQNADNTLQIVDGHIPKKREGFQRGFLACTQRNIINLAFSLLGEGYAWGGSRLGIFGRDCSRLTKDVYAVTGVILPRNSGQQGRVCTPSVAFTEGMDNSERKALLVEHGLPGDLLVLPGHVMLYLGHVDGEPYAIHDVGGNYMRVLVSTLDLYEDSPRGSVLKRLQGAYRVG